jgi:manganese efflux pump family protein
MALSTIFVIALGLSMDAFAVSITSGLGMERFRVKSALRIALFFGGFQALMPVIGYFAGLSIRSLISSFDHWIAFGLLLFVGARMIYESLFNHDDESKMDTEDLATLLMLAVATSIDALAVGLSLSLLEVDIVSSASLIGTVTFVLSFFGVLIGRRAGRALGSRVEILGGVILIGIGFKILLSHLS